VETLEEILAALPLGGWAAGALPAPDDLAALVRRSAETRTRAARACVELERLALLAFDPEALARWRLVHLSLIEGLGLPELSARARAARVWTVALGGDARDDAEARELFREAGRLAMNGLAVEATAAQATILLDRGDLDGALATARRGSRMGRTEGILEEECLANLVLARVRRHLGKPHLASRILVGIEKMAPPSWRRWLSWERALAAGPEAAPCGSAESASGAFVDRSGTGVWALRDLLAASSAGDRAAFADAGARLAAILAPVPALAQEAALLAAALDADATPPPALEGWARGDLPFVPGGLHGPSTASPDQPFAFVLARPGRGGRRFLRAGSALVSDSNLLAASSVEHYRTDTLLAALAIAGPAGVERTELFRSIYGIPYAAALHESVFRGLVHRSRRRIEGRGAITRDGERLLLDVEAPLVIPDPRCMPPTEECVLRLLATRGQAGSEDIAGELRISVRAVQAALKQLVEDGACHPERQGRAIVYRVDDTTFSEPTPYRTA
jgi:hypothetical protein